MPEAEFEDIKKRFQNVENFRRVFASLEDWIERMEWESVKNKHKELRDEFQKIYAKVNQIKSQLELNHAALNSGDISKDQFEKKLRELVGELSIVDLELDSITPKLHRFFDKMKEFIKEGGITEEEQKVLDELNEILDLLSPEKVHKEIRENREEMHVEPIKKPKVVVEEIKVRKEPVEEIKEPRRIVEEIKVRKYCSNCGNPNKDGLKYCKFCGAKLIQI